MGLNKDSSALQMGPLRLLMFRRDSALIPQASMLRGSSLEVIPDNDEAAAFFRRLEDRDHYHIPSSGSPR